MSPLYTAVSFKQVNSVAMFIGKHLYFYVSRKREKEGREEGKGREREEKGIEREERKE